MQQQQHDPSLSQGNLATTPHSSTLPPECAAAVMAILAATVLRTVLVRLSRRLDEEIEVIDSLCSGRHEVSWVPEEGARKWLRF